MTTPNRTDFDGVDFPPWSAGMVDCAFRAAVLNVDDRHSNFACLGSQGTDLSKEVNASMHGRRFLEVT